MLKDFKPKLTIRQKLSDGMKDKRESVILVVLAWLIARSNCGSFNMRCHMGFTEPTLWFIVISTLHSINHKSWHRKDSCRNYTRFRSILVWYILCYRPQRTCSKVSYISNQLCRSKKVMGIRLENSGPVPYSVVSALKNRTPLECL